MYHKPIKIGLDWDLASLFHMIQDASGEAASLRHVSGDDLTRLGLMWVVVRYELNFNRPLNSGEALQFTTWALPFRHKMSQRNYLAKDSDGDIVFSGAGIWVVTDRVSRKMIDPEQYSIAFSDDAPQINIRRPGLPDKVDTTFVGEYTVRDGDLDSNLHMNNTRYFDLAERQFKAFAAGKQMKQVRAAFLSEARLSDTIQLNCGYSDDMAYCFGQKNETDCFQICIRY